MVTLIKPQFEAGRECVGKGGIVRNEAVHREVLLRVIAGIHAQGISPLALTFSPIKGADGNIEYLLFSCKEKTPRLLVTPTMIDAVVKQSHEL